MITDTLTKKIKVILPFMDDSFIFDNNLFAMLQNSDSSITDFVIVFNKRNYLIESQIKVLNNYGIVFFIKENAGIIEAINFVVKESANEYIVIADPSLKFLPGWEQPFLSLAKSKPNLGAAFPKIIDKNNLILEAGFSYLNGNELIGNESGEINYIPKYNYVDQQNFGSQYFLFTRKEVFQKLHGLKSNLKDDFNLALLDYSLLLNKSKFEMFYQPESVIVYNSANNTIKKENEVIAIQRNMYKDEFKVLVVLFYSNHSENNFESIKSAITSEHHGIKIDYILIDLENNNFEVSNNLTINENNPHKIIDETLHKNNYDYIILLQDSIILPENFFSNFINLQNKFKIDIAQPARLVGSYLSHPFVERANGIKARQTEFLCINPVISYTHKVFNSFLEKNKLENFADTERIITNADLDRNDISMGIIDAVPIFYSGHSIVKDTSRQFKNNGNDPTNKISSFNVINVFNF